jgi:hypothetical protein
LSVQPGLRGSNDLRVGRKMATFQLFLQSGLAKDLSATVYNPRIWNKLNSRLNQLNSLLLHHFGAQNSCLKYFIAQGNVTLIN